MAELLNGAPINHSIPHQFSALAGIVAGPFVFWFFRKKIALTSRSSVIGDPHRKELEAEMTVIVPSDEKTVLLLLPNKGQMYPLSTVALTRTQTSRRKLSTDYLGALILDQSGNLKRIERIEVLGPWGTSFGRRLLSRLTDAWSISVHLSEQGQVTLDQLKDVIASCARSPQTLDSMELNGADGLRQFIGTIRAATSFVELIACLKLPAPEAALDVL